jgi:hypothetical protein
MAQKKPAKLQACEAQWNDMSAWMNRDRAGSPGLSIVEDFGIGRGNVCNSWRSVQHVFCGGGD